MTAWRARPRRSVWRVVERTRMVKSALRWSNVLEGGMAGSAPEEVVIMQCAPTGSPQQYEVTVATSSQGAPTVTVGGNCAEAVAGLLASEFRLRHAVPGGMGNIIYTLIKE